MNIKKRTAATVLVSFQLAQNTEGAVGTYKSIILRYQGFVKVVTIGKSFFNALMPFKELKQGQVKT